MGVAGTVGLIEKSRGCLEQAIELKNMQLVIDTTNAFYWYTKEHLLGRSQCDKFGCSMHELGKLYWNLLARLRERDCTLHIVFEGPRLGDRHGPMVSKVDFLRRSSEFALNRLQQGNLSQMDNLPQLAINCLKEVIHEMDQGRNEIHTYQAENEVYPMLVHLSKLYQAPVLTAHSDFIFQDVPAGFVWLERLSLPTSSKGPIYCRLLKHELLLQRYNLDARHSEALGCLCVLLRDDFTRRYIGAINSCLELERAGQCRLDMSLRLKTRRLQYVLENWPRNLTRVSSVLARLEGAAAREPRIRQDFRAIWDCYFQYRPFDRSELADTIRQCRQLSLERVETALTNRETSAEFIASATLKNFHRTGIEDVSTFRSTFSLQDRIKQFLLDKFELSSAELYDRQRSSMQWRYLSRCVSSGSQLSSETLYEMFNFDDAKLSRVSANLRDKNKIDPIICHELALLLLLASYAFKLAPREDYNNQPEATPATANRYTEKQTRVKFLVAILNSYVYLQSRTNQGDQSRSDIPADIRVARDKVEAVAGQQPLGPNTENQEYVTTKHLIECLNSVLHAYKELNSLYDHQGQKLPVSKYYDGVIIYKLMTRYSNNLEGYLLKLDEELLGELL